MPTVRVATFNVHHCAGLDGRVDIPRIAGVIKETGAELVALQELDRGMARSGKVDQPAELARLTGMRIEFFPTLVRGGGEYGIAVATRGGGKFEFHSLPRLGDEEPRGYVLGRWEGMTVVATHLSLQREPRDVQTGAIVRAVASLEGPFVLLGDLNQSAWRLWRAARGRFPVRLWPARTMARRWSQRDHVVAGGGARIMDRSVVRTHASDHYALAATVAVT